MRGGCVFGTGGGQGFIMQCASLCRSTRLLSGEPLGVHQPESERLRHRRSSRYHPLLVFPHTGSRRKYQTRLVITQPLQSSHQTQGSSTCSALTRSVTSFPALYCPLLCQGHIHLNLSEGRRLWVSRRSELLEERWQAARVGAECVPSHHAASRDTGSTRRLHAGFSALKLASPCLGGCVGSRLFTAV